jgi:Flp pilus assembly protein TadB
MASDPRIRASDADRDRVAEALREHHAMGRLTMQEFEERLDRAYAAKTLGDLDELTADLPAIDLYQLPIPADRRTAPAVPGQLPGRLSPVWRAVWASWASLSLVLVVVWLLVGPGWFLWPAGVLGALLAARWIAGAPPGDRGSRRRQLHSHIREPRRDLPADAAPLRGPARPVHDEARGGLPSDWIDPDRGAPGGP